MIVDEINSSGSVVKKQTICSLTNIINQQVGIHKVQAKIKEIEISINIPEKEIFCQIDQISLIRILDNLISNAIKFTHRRGEIKVTAEEKEGKVVIKIRDNGIGVPKKYQETIFDKFTKTRQRGTEDEESNGLGLHIVKAITKHNNGNVFIESEINMGTMVTVELNCDIFA
jgi:two-component system sensor histidine kinase VicK